MLSPTYAIPALPPAGVDLETVEVLRALAPCNDPVETCSGVIVTRRAQ